MLSVAEAQTLILAQVAAPAPIALPLLDLPECAVLAEDVASDLDSPPFDKALMDGYAVRSVDVRDGSATLRVIEEVSAGRVPTKALQAGQATRVMTGAPLPENADAVVMHERTQLDGDQVRIADPSIKPESNLLRRGREMRKGEIVLQAGQRLRPQEVGILAAVGQASVPIFPAPRVAVIATGDEIIDVDQRPGPGQIRNGNGPVQLAQVRRAGGIPRWVGIARDTTASLQERIRDGLRDDVLILTGGVSAGKLDLVPEVLRELGVEALFHKVAMKPGKPVLFGRRGQTLVFGLPGNPVSALVCFELFVRPMVRKWLGLVPGPFYTEARLEADFAYRTDRLLYYPAYWKVFGSAAEVKPMPWFGSADLRGLTAANAFLVVPPGEGTLETGRIVDVLCVDHIMEDDN